MSAIRVVEKPGKSASNELIKLNATFLNNLAVGILVTGFVIPVLIFYGKYGILYNEAFSASRSFWEHLGVEFSWKTIRGALYTGLPVVRAGILGGGLKYIANEMIKEIED